MLVIEKIFKKIDNDIGCNIDVSISRMLLWIYHIKNVDAVKSEYFVFVKFTQIHS